MYNFPSDGVRKVTINNIAPGSINAATAVEVAIVIPGVLPGDVGYFVRQQLNAQAIALDGARCAVAGTMLLRFVNATAGAVTPTATDDYDMFIFRPTGDVTVV